MDMHQYAVEQEMLSYASALLGQSLVENMFGMNSVRREAMGAYLNSVKFSRTAGNYELVMTAARHYWNVCIPLVSQPIERELLKEPFNIILECISATARSTEKEEKTEDEETEEVKDVEEKVQQVTSSAKDKEKKDRKTEKDNADVKTGALAKQKESENAAKASAAKIEDDLTLRAAMYGVLFQSYADKREWFKALEAIDQAVTIMPRTKHRLLIFKHRVMVKAKLGRSVHMDIQKFKDESEDFVAQMWRRVALSSKEKVEQLASYQSAIEALDNESNDFQKVEYLLEFGQWVYSNHFSLNEVEDQLEWASDILLNIKLQEDDLGNSDVEEGEDEDIDYQDLSSALSPGRKGGTDKDASTTRSRTPDKKEGAKKTLKRKDSARSKGSSHLPAIGGGKGHDSKSEISDESEFNAVDYIPIVKEIEIGVNPANPHLTIKDLCDVRQLDALIRSHILLAEVNRLQKESHNDTLIMVYGYIMRLWQILIKAFSSSIKEVVKNGGVLVKEEDTKSQKGGAKDKEKKKEEKPKPKRKFPVDQIPSDIETWATYDWPDEGVEAFKVDYLKHVAINQDTIPKPMLTLHYTTSLIEMLRQAGYNHLALPVLAWQDLLSRTVLKSNALFKLVHLRSLEVCLELDLKSACQHHHRLLGSLHINEEEQAQSRLEIGQWEEKQAQVAKEEKKVTEALARVTGSASCRPKATKRKPPKSNSSKNAGDEESVELHLGKILGKVNHPEIWADTAELLIQQGHYQRAREFLNEACSATQAFKQKTLQAKIFFLMGKLAYHEAQYGQAINFCIAAQEISEAEDKFWFEAILVLTDATIKEKYDIKHVRQTKKLLVHAINEFRKHADNNPNRRNQARFFCAKLETKLVKIHLESILHSRKDVNDPQVLKALLDGSERYESIEEQLVSLHSWREAVPVFLEHSKLLKLLAQEAFEDELKRVYYMQCLMVLRQAYGIAERVYKDCHTLFSLSEMRAVSTPVERELCNVKIELGEVLTDVFAMYDKELRRLQAREERKLSITRIVEDFIRESPVLEDKDKQWQDLGRISADEAAAMFLGTHSMCGQIPRLRAKSLVGLGRLLRILSERVGPDAPAQWLVHDLEVLKMQLAAAEAEAEASRAEAAAQEAAKEEEGEDEGEPVLDTNSNQDEDVQVEQEQVPPEFDEKVLRRHRRYQKKIELKKKQQDSSKSMYTCASEVLSQALNFCLHNSFVDLAGRAAYEIVTLLGQYDALASTMFLSLFQSCQTSQILEHTLFMSQPDPMTSKLAALLHQRKHLLENDVTSNNSASSSYSDIMSLLRNNWQAWKNMEVSANHLDFLKDFPTNYNLVVLQHSPDKSLLFGAILDKPKGLSPGQGGIKSKNQEKLNATRARIYATSVEFAQLDSIISKLAAHKKTVQGVLLKREYQRTQAAQRQRMLATLDEDQQIEELQVDSDDEKLDHEIEEEFAHIVDAMTQYLRPVLEPLCQSLRSSNTPLGSNANIQDGGAKEKTSKDQSPLQNECLVLLADPDLMQLPLEACELLEMVDGVNSISRDFSLQLLYNRMQDEKQAENDTKDGKGGGDAKKKPKDQANLMTRIPGLREAKQKQAKIIPLDRTAQSWQGGVNTMDFRFITDPFLECAETEPNKPIQELNKVIEKYEQQFTPRWLGVPGDDHSASVGEWEIYMTESSSFIFYGMERFLSYIPPEKFSTLNIPECNILLSLDLAETSKSFQRQSKLDVLKTSMAINLEAPVQMMMLASLTGIKCVMGNQWNCTLVENSRKLHRSMHYLLEKGKTTGQTMYMLQNPVKVYEEERANKKVAEAAAKDGEQSMQGKKTGQPAKTSQLSDELKDSKPEIPSLILADAMLDPDKDVEEPKDPNMPKISRTDFNMVCYGMPNLIVIQ